MRVEPAINTGVMHIVYRWGVLRAVWVPYRTFPPRIKLGTNACPCPQLLAYACPNS